MTLAKYFKFLVNGGVLGLCSWGLQMLIFRLFGRGDGNSYALASLLTYIPFMLLNFSIQRRLIFVVPGCFVRFVVVNIFMMFVVSALSPLCREFVTLACGGSSGDYGGFILAAVIGATPSFLLSQFFVFRNRTLERKQSSTGHRQMVESPARGEANERVEVE